MKNVHVLIFFALLAAGPLQAQPPGEIAFWESVRDSKNPAELQAYIDQYPNGTFVVLAKARLAALGSRPAPAALVPPTMLAPEKRLPQAGDTWTYRLSYPRLRGQWGQAGRPPATYSVKVAKFEDGRIVDQLSIDGGTPSESRHSDEVALAPQGVSLLSPYLVATRDLSRPGSLGTITVLDACGKAPYVCTVSGRIIGADSVTVPAGTFAAIKVAVEESWSGTGGAQAMARLTGGRTLVVWYVPQIKRAVKFSSRPTVGDVPPVESNFDLELVSYQLK